MSPADAAAFQAIVGAVAAEDPTWARRCRRVRRRHRLGRVAWKTLRIFTGVSEQAPDVYWPLHIWW